MLSDVIVTTEVPTVPTYDDGRICWPVGTFRSTLWENEVQLAIEHGAHVEVQRCWTYERAHALHGFCSWVLDQLDYDDGDIDPVIRLALEALVARADRQVRGTVAEVGFAGHVVS